MSEISRRHFLKDAVYFGAGAALLGAGISLRAYAKGAPAKPLRDDVLPDPDFDQLRDTNPFLVGIRPYRTSGVRLERVAAPLEGPRGAKTLIHNYGHGGAGITLSWGCASVVVDHVADIFARAQEGATHSVAIMGTGVIGLTTATELKRKWPTLPITIYAKDLALESTVSFVAGGQFEPSGMHRLYKTKAQQAVLADYMRRAKARIEEIQNGGQRHDFGVAVRKNYTLDHRVEAFESLPREIYAPPRRGRLPFAKLNGPGREYSTYLMNPLILLPKLVADLEASGVKFATRMFETEKDVAALDETLVINCTGLGSKKLFGDADLVPQRGHNVVLKKTDPKQFYFMSGGCENKVIAYYFCRQDDIVVGGTVQSGNDSLVLTDDDEKTFSRLLKNGKAMFAGTPRACVWK